MAKRKKSTLQHVADAKDSAKWADEFSGLTAKKKKNAPANLYSPGDKWPKKARKDQAKEKKYGKWAKESARDAHNSRSAALRQNRANATITDKTKRPESNFKPHGYTQGDNRKD